MKKFTYEGGTLYLGDYRDVLASVENIKLIVTSPPYNLGTTGTRKDGYRREGRYDPKSFTGVTIYEDAFPDDTYSMMQAEFLRWAGSRISKKGCIAYNHKNRPQNKVLISPWAWLMPLHNRNEITVQQEIVWDRGSTHNHDKNYFYPQTERIWLIRHPHGNYKLRNKIAYEGESRGLGDVWSLPLNSRSAIETKHQAAFPLRLVQTCLDTLTRKGDLVCDPYSGSGTSFIASVERGRKFVGAEKNPKIFDLACERIKEHFKLN